MVRTMVTKRHDADYYLRKDLKNANQKILTDCVFKSFKAVIMLIIDQYEARTFKTSAIVEEVDVYYAQEGFQIDSLNSDLTSVLKPYKSFSSKWGNFRRSYFVAAPGAGYRGSVAPFRIEKDGKEPRKELRLNFSRLQPKTVLRIIGKHLFIILTKSNDTCSF